MTGRIAVNFTRVLQATITELHQKVSSKLKQSIEQSLSSYVKEKKNKNKKIPPFLQLASVLDPRFKLQ